MAIAASVLTDAHTATWFIYGAVLQVNAPKRQPEFEKKRNLPKHINIQILQICQFQNRHCYNNKEVSGENQSTRIKPTTRRKTLTRFYHIMLHRVHPAMPRIRTHNFSDGKYSKNKHVDKQHYFFSFIG
jgi:hypothetical protein